VPFQSTEIAGVHLFTPKLFGDSRGLFYESFRPDQVLSETGYDFSVAQVNNSVSSRGVVRGIHFKENPPGQAKFVSVHRGSIVDVVIDLRQSSPTFKKWQAFELNDQNRNSLLIGNGIGHSFVSLEDETFVSYLCDTIFQPDLEHGINPLSSGIDWQSLTGLKPAELIVSDKDLAAPNLEEARSLLFP
jgi:dTDP-4-dehydrorhamnose 3,5-epimerase